jgi:hypothetical protein
MRNLIAVAMVVLTLLLVACATRATKTFVVEVSRIGIEYTPGQVREYLENRGFQRVRFKNFSTDDLTVYERRDSDSSEQHFRWKAHPQIGVVVRLEKNRRTFGNPEPRLIVYFNEDGRGSLSELAAQEYDQLFRDIVERVGAEKVKVWN